MGKDETESLPYEDRAANLITVSHWKGTRLRHGVQKLGMLRLKDGMNMLINMHVSTYEILFLLEKALAVIWEISFDHSPLTESILFARPQAKLHQLWGTITERKERHGTAGEAFSPLDASYLVPETICQ